MRFQTKIEKVKDFATNNDLIGIIATDEKYFCLQIHNNVSLSNFDSPEISRSVYLVDDYFIISDILNMRSLIINNKNLIEKELSYLMSFPFKVDDYRFSNYIFASVRQIGKNKEVAKIDISTFEIKETYPLNFGINGIWKVISEDLFISLNDQKIGLCNFKNEIIWQHSFSELIQSEKATLRSKILEKYGKLFFVVSGTLFCLDVNSGIVEHFFENYSYEIFQDEEHIYTSKYENILCRINPENFEVEEWDVDELVKKNGFDNIHDHRCAAKNGLFYFTQTLGDNKAKFGVLDFNNKQLIYKYEFEPKNGGISSIQVSETRIFVHTQDNTLHVFEAE